MIEAPAMDRRSLAPVLILALLASPLAAAVCAAGACARGGTPASAHCAMATDTGTTIEAVAADCCSGPATHDVATMSQDLPLRALTAADATVVEARPQPLAAPGSAHDGSARGAPTERLHQLGVLLL